MNKRILKILGWELIDEFPPPRSTTFIVGKVEIFDLLALRIVYEAKEVNAVEEISFLLMTENKKKEIIAQNKKRNLKIYRIIPE